MPARLTLDVLEVIAKSLDHCNHRQRRIPIGPNEGSGKLQRRVHRVKGGSNGRTFEHVRIVLVHGDVIGVVHVVRSQEQAPLCGWQQTKHVE